MIKYKFSIFSIVLIVLSFVRFSYAEGQLMVMPSKTSIEGLEAKKIHLSNLGDRPLYLKLSLEMIQNPGHQPEKKIRLGEMSHPELMINTSKLTLGPGQKKDILVTPLTVPSSESVYRLYIIPVSSIKVSGSNIPGKIEAPVTFGIGYGIVINHLPNLESQKRESKIECVDRKIKVIANGNTHSIVEISNNSLDGLSAEHINVYPNSFRILNISQLKGTIDGEKVDFKCH